MEEENSSCRDRRYALPKAVSRRVLAKVKLRKNGARQLLRPAHVFTLCTSRVPRHNL
jgi:hypothetical protein